MKYKDIFKVETRVTVDGDDLARAIEEYMGFPEYSYNIVAQEELGNHSWELSVSEECYDAASVGVMKDAGKPAQFKTSDILDVMCLSGLIPKGNYLVDVSW
jgi:hypothetical protein